MKKILAVVYRQGLALLLSSLFLFQLAACGTIIYPERRGQTKGELDPLIVVLDAVGLLFFIIPGVAAFIIDFNTGTIYMPHGKHSQERIDKIRKGFEGSQVETRSDGSIIVRVDPKQLTPEAVESVGKLIGGDTFSLHNPDLQVQRLDADAVGHVATSNWTTAAFCQQMAAM